MKELLLTKKRSADLIREFDIVHPKPDHTIMTAHILEWIENYYKCRVQGHATDVVLEFEHDKDLTFFLLKHPC